MLEERDYLEWYRQMNENMLTPAMKDYLQKNNIDLLKGVSYPNPPKSYFQYLEEKIAKLEQKIAQLSGEEG